jgi:hypothetical protein
MNIRNFDLNVSFCLLLIVVVICCNFIIFLRCSMYRLLHVTKSFQYLTYISISINDNSRFMLIFANARNEEQNRNLYVANLYFFASIIVTSIILFFFNVTRLLALYCYHIRYTLFRHNYFDDLRIYYQLFEFKN